jgi:hypothetical protein
MNRKLYLVLFLFFSKSIIAQEFLAKISVNASRINTTVDRRIFTTLQNQLNNFFNNRKWTNEAFKNSEKISCNFILNLESQGEQNVYKGQLIIQAARPIHSTTYNSALINFQDIDVQFKYIEYQPVEFNENRVAGSEPNAANLTAIFAYYANIILGLSYDSYAAKGGEKYFQKAQNIVNNAPEANGLNGWKAFDGFRNRYWLIENLINPRNNILHTVVYDFYRNGLDKMIMGEKQAVKSFIEALNKLKSFNIDNPNTMFVQFFLQNRQTEIAGIIKRGEVEDKNRAIEILQSLDPTNIEAYKSGIK